MPIYKSKTGRKVVFHLGKQKTKVVVNPTPNQLPQMDLHKLFPKHVELVAEDQPPLRWPTPQFPVPASRLDELVRAEIERQIPQKFVTSTTLRTGAWSGQRCFIIAGGPSLAGFDFSKLQGERVIAINKAFVNAPFADIQFSIDRQFLEWLIEPAKCDGKMDEAAHRWPSFGGHKVWLKIPGNVYAKQVEFVKLAGQEGISTSLEEGLYSGSNSGYAAINLAAAMGANPIYLLGYDMNHDKFGRTHYHAGYKKPQKEAQLKMFAKKFPRLADEARKKGIQIVNLNKNSAISCFEYGDIDQVLKSTPTPYTHKWRVISFYTANTSYEQEIIGLKNSLEKFGIDYHFFACEQKGSWRKNLNAKSECILQAFDMFPDQDIVFIDADGIVRQYPILFDKLSATKDSDVAATFHKYSPRSGDEDELLSGTLWFPNNDRARNLVQRWHEIGLDQEKIRHQQCLRIAIEQKALEGDKVKVYRMPHEYTHVFDYKYKDKNKPVIEHFQASRRFRKEVGYGDVLTWRTQNIPIKKKTMPNKNIPKINTANVKVSVVVVTYRRLDTLDQVLSAWLKETPDVWLCDCSKEGYKTNLPVKIVRATPDPGNKIRHAVATMTSGDLVIKADDDIIPLPGLAQDFINCYVANGDCVMGIHGRTFQGPDYYQHTTLYSAKHLLAPLKVDFLGVITCAPRKFLAMDLKDCDTPIEDLYWHNWIYPHVPKYIITSTHYQNLPSSRDQDRLCGNKEMRVVRRAFYKKCYEKYYKK